MSDFHNSEIGWSTLLNSAIRKSTSKRSTRNIEESLSIEELTSLFNRHRADSLLHT
jgi:hypothetical protein